MKHNGSDRRSVHLHHPAGYRILQGVLGDIVLRPWLDRAALRLSVDFYFPLSRGWALANTACGSVDRFLAELSSLPGVSKDDLRRPVAVVERRLRIYQRAATAWETAFFGPVEADPDDLVRAESARRSAAHELMTARYAFLPLYRRLPAVKWEITDPRTVEAVHGPRLATPALAFPAPAMPAVDTSRRVPGAQGDEFWLRFRSPALADTAWARVYAPRDARDPPTLIFLHGIAMETEMWEGLADSASPLLPQGIRVIRPEGPWHGRRCPLGWYGGEPVMARGPIGFLELFHAWIGELAVLIDWARRTSRGPVAVGGVSLGALTCQLAAIAARDWPTTLVPDALFLAATSGSMLDTTCEGALARALALPTRLERGGWTRTDLERWLPLLEPRGALAVPAENVVMLLGRKDDVIPFAGGLRLARNWGVPEANVFLRHQGHFSLSLGLLHDTGPLDRLAELLLSG